MACRATCRTSARKAAWAALIEANRVPIHPDAITLSQRDGRSPLLHALHDGEDYELLFTAPGDEQRFADIAVRIGQIIEHDGLWLMDGTERSSLRPMAWEHRL